MSKAHTSGAQICGYVGGGHAAAPGAAGWLGLRLSLAAAPTFGLMGLWTIMSSGQPGMLCMSMYDASPFNGMALMYALMSVFHAGPWLKLISSRRSGARRSQSTVLPV
jgi:hypothetical protein